MMDNMQLTPHGFCLLWDQYLLPTMLLGDGLTALAYFIIPYLLWSRRHGVMFSEHVGLRVMFGGFILFCGLTHVLHIVTMFYPFYWTEAVTKVATGVVSLFTAATIPFLTFRAVHET